LNVDFDGLSLDFLGSRKPAHEGIKERYPRKSRHEMAGDRLTVCEQELPRLSRVPWALAQISCSFKRWDLVATILIIFFPRINWPHLQNLCCLNVCFCFAWDWGSRPLSPLPTPLTCYQHHRVIFLRSLVEWRLRFDKLCCGTPFCSRSQIIDLLRGIILQDVHEMCSAGRTWWQIGFEAMACENCVTQWCLTDRVLSPWSERVSQIPFSSFFSFFNSFFAFRPISRTSYKTCMECVAKSAHPSSTLPSLLWKCIWKLARNAKKIYA